MLPPASISSCHFMSSPTQSIAPTRTYAHQPARTLPLNTPPRTPTHPTHTATYAHPPDIVRGAWLGKDLQGAGFRARVSGSRAQGSGFRTTGIRIQGPRLRVQGMVQGPRAQDLQGSGFRARGSGSRIGPRVLGFRIGAATCHCCCMVLAGRCGLGCRVHGVWPRV